MVGLISRGLGYYKWVTWILQIS